MALLKPPSGGVVAVIGLGYVGLPLSVAFAQAGFQVIGVDTDAGRVGQLLEGRSYVEDIPSDLLAAITDRFHPTTSYQRVAEAQAVVIAVPTPLRKSKDPDISHVLSALEAMGDAVRPGMLIVLESTTYPGTTVEVMKPFFEARGLVVGRDIWLAFSPERIDPGNSVYGIRNTPKIVGGITPACTERAQQLYGTIVERVVPVSSPTVAEFAKLLENTFRAVNIALVNELAILCRRIGIDPYEVVDSAATKPFGFMPFYPGPGIGGHCIPVDPMYLSWKARLHNYRTRAIELADDINSAMPQYVVQRIFEALNEQQKSMRGARIVVLGISYKKNVSDYRESPIMQILQELQERGALVSYHDPHVAKAKADGVEWTGVALTPTLLQAADLVVLGTDHDTFDRPSILQHARNIFDTRNFFGGIVDAKIHRL